MTARFNIDEFDRSIRSDSPLRSIWSDADWDEPTEPDWDADWDEPTEPPYEDTDECFGNDDGEDMPYPDEPWDDDEVAD